MQTISGSDFVVNVVKSKRRKTMALKVNHSGVSLYIPASLPESVAETFIAQKASWIRQKLQDYALQQPVNNQFDEGDTLLFLGQHHILRFVEGTGTLSVIRHPEIIECHGSLTRASKKAIRMAIVQWYKQQAQHYLTERTLTLGHQIKLHPRSITVKTYKARWGSCSYSGDIYYNWQLMLAPPDIIDYVIIHELCHTKHHNHSPAFWQLVKYHYPHANQAKTWLKANGYTLSL